MIFGCPCTPSGAVGFGQADDLTTLCRQFMDNANVAELRDLLVRVHQVVTLLKKQFEGNRAVELALDTRIRAVTELRQLVASADVGGSGAPAGVFRGETGAICFEVNFAESQARLNPGADSSAARLSMLTALESGAATFEEIEPTVVTPETPPAPPAPPRPNGKGMSLGVGIALASVGVIAFVGLLAYAARQTPAPRRGLTKRR